jgi:DNA-binding response OmpR family regulator
LAGNRKILIIDDEAPIRQVVALKLKNRGYDVLSATDGAEGLRLIVTEAPDVVITDINMPRLDGKKLCEMTCRLKEDRSFLTVVMTARIMPEERQWINKMPDTLFMEKPFSPRQLLECIDAYFGVKR